MTVSIMGMAFTGNSSSFGHFTANDLNSSIIVLNGYFFFLPSLVGLTVNPIDTLLYSYTT